MTIKIPPTSLTQRVACPAWCVRDHGADTEPTIIHTGEAETFDRCTIAFDNGPALNVTLGAALRTAPGMEPERGLMVSGHSFDLARAKAFLAGLRDARN